MDISQVFKLHRAMAFDSELTHAEKSVLWVMILRMDNASATVKDSQANIYSYSGVSKKAYYAMIKKDSVRKYFTIKKLKLDRVEIKMQFPEVTNEFPEVTPGIHYQPVAFVTTSGILQEDTDARDSSLASLASSSAHI